MPRRWTHSTEILQTVVAVCALLLGILIYGLFRDPEQLLLAGLLPTLTDSLPGSSPGKSPAVFYSLPSFLHIYAFILLSCVVVAASINSVRLICLFWLVTELLFEIGQHDAVATFLITQLPEPSTQPGWLQALVGYFVNGRFDTMDILALILGAASAYVSILTTRRWREKHLSA